MRPNFSNSNDRSSFNDSTNQLEWMVDWFMPQLHPFWKRILLEDRQSAMTGVEIARRILHKRGRTDVEVYLSPERYNCYSRSQNWIFLSEDVASSRSVLAAAIAAHEVGHALQPTVMLKIGGVLRTLPNYLLPILINLVSAFTLVTLLRILFTILAVGFARCFVFWIEIDASLSALRLLKQYKILGKQERKAARKFLLAAALSYLHPLKSTRTYTNFR
jgi:hypothetical protein